MVEPVSMSIAVATLLGSIATAIIQLFSDGVKCGGCIANCCVVEIDNRELPDKV